MIRVLPLLFLLALLPTFTETVSATDIRIVGKDLIAFDESGAEIDTLKLEGIPASLAYSPDGALLYVRLANENSIAVFEVKTLDLADWYSMDDEVKGRRLDVDYWSIDPVGGRLVFRDMKGESVFANEWRDAARMAEAPTPAPLQSAGDEMVLSQLPGTKSLPSVDFDSDGEFAASWTDLSGNDGDGEGVYLREFDSSGNPRGGEFRAAVQKNGGQGNSSLSCALNGDFVVVWRDDSGEDGDTFGVFGRRFQKGGAPKDSQDVKIANSTAGRQKEASVDSEPDGDFVVVWDGPSGNDKAVFARRFSANGSPKGNEIVVDTTSNTEYAPDVATNSSGRFVATWRDGADDLLHARIYDSSGNPIGGVFKVDSGAHSQFVPNVGMDESGNITFVFESNGAGGIIYRQYDSNGSPKGGSRVAGHDGLKEYAPSLSMNANGQFCIAWRDSNSNAWARSFKSNGDPDGPINRTSSSDGGQFEPNCAIDQNGNFLATWKHRQDGGAAIKGHRFNTGGSSGLNVTCAADPTEGLAPLKVHFSASATGGNGNYDFSWAFGDGDFSSRHSTRHTYSTTGDFDAVVTVTSGSDTAACTQTIHVGTTSVSITVTALTVSRIDRNTPDTTLSVKGTGFVDGATVSFNDPGIEVFTTNFVSSEKIKIHVNVTSTAFLGFHDVTVTNPDGTDGTGKNLLKILDGGNYPAPTVISIDPNGLNAGTNQSVKITGFEFANDPDVLHVNFGESVTVTDVQWISPTEIHASTTVDSHAVCGARDVIVSNATSDSQPCVGCLFVSSAKVAVGSISPSSLRVGEGPVDVTISGCGFKSASTAKIKGTDKISQTLVDSSTIILTVKVKDTTDPGFKTVSVRNSSTDSDKRKDIFEVKP